MMSTSEPDYSNTLFYKISCKDPTIDEVYVGHTTNFVQRKCAHKNSCTNPKSAGYSLKLYKTIRDYGGWNNWNMEIIAFRNCNDSHEARKVEQELYDSLGATLNSIPPLPPRKPKPARTLCPKANAIPSDAAGRNKVFSGKFVCKICHYTTPRKSQYDRHLTTDKHKRTMNNDLSTLSNSKTYNCECGKVYKYRQGLFAHREICKRKHNLINANEPDPIPELSNNLVRAVDASLVFDLLKQNQDFKDLIIEQSRQLLDQQNKLLMEQQNRTNHTEQQNKLLMEQQKTNHLQEQILEAINGGNNGNHILHLK